MVYSRAAAPADGVGPPPLAPLVGDPIGSGAAVFDGLGNKVSMQQNHAS